MMFDSWADLGRILIVGTLAYASLVLLLRVSGKRTLTKLNAFDLVVTVALGSTLATVLLNRSVSLAEGIVALGLLVFLQFAITWAQVRSNRFQGWIKAEPTLVLHRGRFLEAALRRERLTREEVLAACRSNGAVRETDIHAVILETDGSMSVIRQAPDQGADGAGIPGVRVPDLGMGQD